MKLAVRLHLTFVSSISALFFTFWMGGALLYGLGAPQWASLPLALLMMALTARYTWHRTAILRPGLIGSIALGAVTIGSVGFVGGFFGPIIFMPGANQGPLLGLFITGPLGFILGAIGGGVHWLVRGRHREALQTGTA